MKIYFVTMNDFKAKEVTEYLKGSSLELQIVPYRIQEILNLDLEVIVKDKVLKAYAHLGHPCVVEHGGLLIQALNNLPGGLSKVVWDNVGDKLCSFLGPTETRSATAQSVIGYCDGQRVHTFKGETKGSLADCARGSYDFQWDPVFIPDGESRTYAELGFPEKAKHSQAAKVWRDFVNSLTPNV
jgi:XTP/dITP diphosphohydrolase